MSYYDVIFPVNLGPLTYKCPDELIPKAVPGTIVSAPLRNRITRGILFGKTSYPPKGHIKEIREIHDELPALGKPLLDLIQWISHYYIASEGLTVKQTIPAEIFMPVRSRKSKKELLITDTFKPYELPDNELSTVSHSIHHKHYQAFLMQTPSDEYQYSAVYRLLELTKNIIVLFPEISTANYFYSSIRGLVNDRACILHSGVAKGRRSEFIQGIASGRFDIVIGTRHALFAPLKDVSLIIVCNEHSLSYKQEDGIRFHMRDAAIMRGFMEKAVVLLTSVTPSVDSCFNAFHGKYTLISPDRITAYPKIRVVDMRFDKKMHPEISKKVFDSVKKAVKTEQKILFFINRKGYSTSLICTECGHVVQCPVCSIPLVLHRDTGLLKCHYCGMTDDVPENCSECKGHSLELHGAGTEKIQEVVKEIFGVDTLRFDREKMRKQSDIRKAMIEMSDDPAKILIGTKLMTKHWNVPEKYSLAVVLRIDNSLNFADFRASEKTYMELRSIVELVSPEGEVIIQTRNPQNHIFRHLKNDSYPSFVKEELAMRQELGYPPYMRLLGLRFGTNTSVEKKIIKLLQASAGNIDILGPITARNKKGIEECSILLRSSERKSLNAAARAVVHSFKETKDARIIVDVDPV